VYFEDSVLYVLGRYVSFVFLPAIFIVHYCLCAFDTLSKRLLTCLLNIGNRAFLSVIMVFRYQDVLALLLWYYTVDRKKTWLYI